MNKIEFNFYKKRPALKDRVRLKRFIETLFIIENRRLNSLTYIFCSDEFLFKLNKEFLKHDYFTDVITFELGTTETDAEVYISGDRVKDNAKLLKNTYNDELHRVIFHGALHLCGYNDKTKKDASIMRLKEEEYLKKYFNET